MAIALDEERDEAIEMEDDLLGNGGRADADNSEGESARHLRGEGVGNRIAKGVGEARHLS